MVAATIYPTAKSDISNLADATISIVDQAFSLALKKRVLSHQEYKQLLNSIGWNLKESKLYLKVADAFSSFSPDDLQEIEPHTIFDLAKHTKKYNQVIESLKDCGKITQEKVQELIAAHRTPKKAKPDKPTIWKTGRDGEPVCRIPDIMEDDMQSGNIIQQEMDQNGTFPQTVIRKALQLWHDVQEGKLVVQEAEKNVEQDTEVPQNITNHFQEEDFVEEESKSVNLNTFSECDTSESETTNYNEDASQEHHNSDNIIVNEAKTRQSANIDLSLSDDCTLPFEQIVETLTRAESWLEVENAIDNYPQSAKSQIWGLLDTATQERFHQLKQEHLTNIDKALKVNDKVMWEKCPGNLYSLQPFIITKIEGDKATLDLFSKLIPLKELTKYKE
ncbi:MAG: hypothetical protein HC785_30835 [Calothrix sp. CSU_2_0]|nr:hypothetical protein [Calothrix sp. CSU_2_0]